MKTIADSCNLIKKPAVILAVLAILAGCRGTIKPPSEEKAGLTRSQRWNKYDPIGLTEDSRIIPAEYARTPVFGTAYISDSVRSNVSSDSAAAEPDSHICYRIQLFTSKTYGPAARELKIAREIFDKEIYLDYEVPYYKVRAGDFARLQEAEQYLPAAIEAGYETAWVVKVVVDVEQSDEFYDTEEPASIESPDSISTKARSHEDSKSDSSD
jgi:hypothetical protein